MKLAVVTLKNESAGDIELDDKVFGVEARQDILTRAVNWQRAKRQSGCHKTKGISEISGTGKKPFKQKGTGRARQGSLRSAQMRGGATIFGPQVRSHAFDMPKKVRKLALKCALSAKAAAGKLKIVDNLDVDTHKTKPLHQMLSGLEVSSALIVGQDTVPSNFRLAARNIPHIDVVPQIGANVYDILRHDTLVLSRDAATSLQERLA